MGFEISSFVMPQKSVTTTQIGLKVILSDIIRVISSKIHRSPSRNNQRNCVIFFHMKRGHKLWIALDEEKKDCRCVVLAVKMLSSLCLMVH